MPGSTTEEIREAFAQDIAVFVAMQAARHGLHNKEGMVAFNAAITLFEKSGVKQGWSAEDISDMKNTGEIIGVNIFTKAEGETAKAVEGRAKEGRPQLGSGQTLGQKQPAPTPEPEKPKVVGPEDGTGILGVDGEEVKEEAWGFLSESKVVGWTISTAIGVFMFPMGAAVHIKDSISMCAATLQFLLMQDHEHSRESAPEEEISGRDAMSKAISNAKDRNIKLGNDIFGPSGPKTIIKEPSPIVGVNGEALGHG